MIENISIKNYRNLKELEIPSLGRVNLIAGMNNAGKSSFLEAIAILLSRADMNLLLDILKTRSELLPSTNDQEEKLINVIDLFSSFFSNWEVNIFGEEGITIAANFGNLHLKLVKYSNQEEADEATGITRLKRVEVPQKYELDYPDAEIGLKITFSEEYLILPLNSGVVYQPPIYSYPERLGEMKLNLLRTNNEKAETEKLWDQITLSPKEDFVLEALRIIEPTIQRLAFIHQNEFSKKRVPVVSIKGVEKRIPLGSMGDGINKVLKIILSLVNSENGHLLIDEFENGLHHSSQDALWELIFNFAYENNVQIFATTHSDDSIFSFENALNSKDEYKDSKLFRLDKKGDKTIVVEYTAEDLAIATDQHIETR